MTGMTDYDRGVGGHAYAAASGTVTVVNSGCLGYHLIVDHGNGYRTIYGHLQLGSASNFLDTQGQAIHTGSTVNAGMPIGEIGGHQTARHQQEFTCTSR